MSGQKMTPGKSFNASVPCFGKSGKNKVKTPKIPPALMMLHESQEFQCIACQFVRKSPNEIHHHQTYFHSSEELSLAIIGLQVLYNFNKSRNTISATKSELDDNIVNPVKENNKKTPSLVMVPDSMNQSVYPEVQKEPMCLKVSIPFSILDTNVSSAENYAFDLKSHTQNNNNNSVPESVPKNAKPSIRSLKRKITAPLGPQKIRKEIPIKPAPLKIEEVKVQSRSAKNFPEVKLIQEGFTRINVSQIIRNNILKKTLVSHNGSYLPDQTFSSSLASVKEPICLNLTQKNLPLNCINVGTQKESEGIFKMPEEFKGTKETINRPELTIEKIDPNFKKPQPVLRKPTVTIIKKVVTCTMKQEVNKPKKEVNTFPESQQTAGSFSKNLNNLCEDIQKDCLKWPHSKSLNITLDSLEPPLQKPELDLIKIDSILETPVTSIKILEPSPKKLKSPLKVSSEEIKNENDPIKNPLPIIEVGDVTWYETVKNKLHLGNELPMDITNIALQDLPTQSFELLQNTSENFNYNDLSSETFDSYLMPSENQPQAELNSTSQIRVEEMNNNFSCLNSTQGLDTGFDCSNSDFFFVDNQHQLIPVNSNESAWNLDGNPVYAELLPVLYS